jgi:hypothetical protein
MPNKQPDLQETRQGDGKIPLRPSRQCGDAAGQQLKESQKYRKYTDERQKIYGQTGFRKNLLNKLATQFL